MINISLPLFYENYKFNNFFKQYSYEKNKTVIDFNIEYSYGSFPQSSWNGGPNIYHNNLVLYGEMERLRQKSFIPFRIDCSNCFLNDNDYYDRHQNVILDIYSDSGNIIDISNLKLLNHLQEKYLNLQYSFSNNAEILHQFNPDIINTIIEQDNCVLVTFNSANIINDIKNKQKCELVIGKQCPCPVNTYLQCISIEQNNQLNFSKNSQFQSCAKTIKKIDYIKEIENNKIFSHFKIAPPKDIKQLYTFNQNLIFNFIKPEYWEECLNLYQKGIILKNG